MSKKSSDFDSMTTPIISAEITYPDPIRLDLESLNSIKVYQRKDEMNAKLPCGYFCCVVLCGGCCRCCSMNIYDISRNTCCCCCIPTKKPSWNHRFDMGVSILGNTMHNLYPHEKCVPIMRLLADNELHPWLPFFPKHVTVHKGKKSDGFLESLGHEWVYPSEQGYPDFTVEYTKQRRFILYIHGGGFVIGGPFSHRLLIAELCRETGATILVIRYRRAPEYKYPLAEYDCLHAYQYMISNVSSNRVMLAGDSAGGALVIGTLIRIRNEGLSRPRGGICLSPWVDLFENETESCRTNCHIDYIPARLIPFAGQLYVDPPDGRCSVTNQDLVGLPPILIEIGEAEVLRDVILLFVRKAEAAGVQVSYNLYKDMVHVFQLFTITNQAETRESFRNIARYMDRLYADDVENRAHDHVDKVSHDHIDIHIDAVDSPSSAIVAIPPTSPKKIERSLSSDEVRVYVPVVVDHVDDVHHAEQTHEDLHDISIDADSSSEPILSSTPDDVLEDTAVAIN